MHTFLASLRVAVLSIVICVVVYTGLVVALARVAVPHLAQGSLLQRSDGTVIGSSLIAQAFSKPGYFWPRPSAVEYNGAGAGGSNKSPTSPALAERARALVARYGATGQAPLPPELVTASGSGLDPHISMHAAVYQSMRVAAARDLPLAQVLALVEGQARSPGESFSPGPIINVLELNLALDRLSQDRLARHPEPAGQGSAPGGS